ncbi:hypothetical protein PARMER_00646, partial [Parabacteroides merdae ATCC 43184]
MYKYFTSKLKSFIRWKENEGATGMTTDRPFIHDPVRNFSKSSSGLVLASRKQPSSNFSMTEKRYIILPPSRVKATDRCTGLVAGCAGHFIFSTSSRPKKILARLPGDLPAKNPSHGNGYTFDTL